MLQFIFILFLLTVIVILLWPARAHKNFCLGVGASFFIAAFALYGFAGAPEILPLMAARNAQIGAIKNSIRQHSEAVKADPQNLVAWVALGQDFLEAGQWEAAVNALKQAVLLSKGDPKLILAYAKATIMVSGGQVTDDAKKSLQMVLLQEPKNADARYYLAVRQLQDGHTQEAMKEMKTLYSSLPDDSPLKAMMNRQIGK